jgi:hypothetical protein
MTAKLAINGRLTTNLLLAAFVAVASGCGSSDGAGTPATDSTRVPSIDLALGAQGDEVRFVHAYLKQFGYFPNSDLEQQYPRWRPIVAQAPAAADVYDEHTVEAVRALQANMGLPKTGVVDAPTRALLVTPRCAVPDGITRFDPSDKFSLLSYTRGNKVTYSFQGAGGPANAVFTAISAASEWMGASNDGFDMSLTTDSADISISFGSFPPCQNGTQCTNGQTSPDGSTITLNTARSWSIGTTTPARQMDLESIVLHEMGHALGLGHSSLTGAVMYPFFNVGQQPKQLPIEDDRVPMIANFGGWTLLPGAARDIGIGANGDVWVIGTDGNTDGSIFKWNPNTSQWDHELAHGAGVRISVMPGGAPVVVTSNGNMYLRQTGVPSRSSDAWYPLVAPGISNITGALDVGVGADGSIWTVANGPSGGDGTVFKLGTLDVFHGVASWVQDQSGGAGQRIAVGSDGIPWVINSPGQVWQRQTKDPTTGSWNLQRSGGGTPAVDIGISGDPYPWVTAFVSPSSFFDPFTQKVVVLDSQAGLIGGAPAENSWVSMKSQPVLDALSPSSIAASPYDQVWVVSSTNQIYVH